MGLNYINPATQDTELHTEKLRVWDIVFEAQTAATAAFKQNNTAASVDLAARKVIEDAGYGYGFTHRVGHGIGIKGKDWLFTIPVITLRQPRY